MKTATEDYVARISNATPLQLVIITYDIILDYLNAAKKSLDNKSDFEFNITKARQFVTELKSSLNMEYSISKYLMRLYSYVDEQLSLAFFNYKTDNIIEAERVLTPLLEGWHEVECKEGRQETVMDNVEHIYAGLTYGKDGSLQEFVDSDTNRGFTI